METLGYDLAPLTGLWNHRPQGGNFVGELLAQATGGPALPVHTSGPHHTNLYWPGTGTGGTSMGSL
jgi:hypothetical protein